MRLIFITGLLFLPLLGFAQETEKEILLLQQLNEGQDVIAVPELKKPVMDKIDFGLQAGGSFTSFGKYGSIFSSYVAPEIRYQATSRFQFRGGVMFTSSFMPGAREGLYGAGGPANQFNQFLVYAEGEYRVNDRLSLGGIVVKELDNNTSRQMNAFQKNAGFQSMGMRVNYKITDNFHFGAQFSVTEGRPYYYSNPANPFMRRSPFNQGW